MYIVNINKSVLILVDLKDKSSFKLNDKTYIVEYLGDGQQLMKYVFSLYFTPFKKRYIIVSKDLTKLKYDFKSLFKKIKAAGGLVFNEKNEILFIRKNNWWGLPKGKLKKTEKRKVAAIREVIEETGANNLEIVEKLGKTITVKKENGIWKLKTCHWYHMTAPNQLLKPQIKEGINKAVWISISDFNIINPRMYNSLQYVLDFVPFIIPENYRVLQPDAVTQ